jgi:hypothetical protein
MNYLEKLLSRKQIFVAMFFLIFFQLFFVGCKQASLSGIEPVKPAPSVVPTPKYPAVSQIALNKTTITLTGENLANPTNVQIQAAGGTAQTLSVVSSTATSIVANTSSAILVKLNTVYSILVTTAEGATTSTFTVDLTNITAGAFSVGTNYLVVASDGRIGMGTAAPTAGVTLDVASAGASASAIIIPRDTTANRPATGVAGMMRYNTTTNRFEVYETTSWLNITPDTKCASQYLTYPSVTTSVSLCIALMPSAAANTNNVAAVNNSDTTTSDFGTCGAANNAYPGILVGLGTTSSSCKKRCTITAHCDANGQWVSPVVSLAP